jgi:hypothetical protein
MSAVVTDQFRILNASNFVDSVSDSTNAYYIFLGLTNPTSVGFGRTDNWDSDPPSPVDNLDYLSHYHDTSIFGKKITSSNIRRIIRKIEWTTNTKYEMYRHDYSSSEYNRSPLTNSSRLYNTNYYVVNSDYRVYICIDNGSSGINPSINGSLDEPKFTTLEPQPAGESGDGYIWKYLFTISPSDVIKFDSTEYIVVPNNWDKPISEIEDAEIVRVKENGDSTANNNQIKKVYIENGGNGYSTDTGGTICDILGDGTGGKVLVKTENNVIVSTTVTFGGSGYTYGIVDLGPIQPSTLTEPAKLIPIIPPSKGHGYDIYKELGTDKVLIYARFDDSTKDFPTDTSFSQIGILKNPTTYGSNEIFKDNQYSSLYSIKLSSGTPTIGQKITQKITGVGTAVGYVASYDSETQVLKYYQDRSLFFGSTGNKDQTDYDTVSDDSKVLTFSSSGEEIKNFSGSINVSFGNPTPTNKVTVGNKVIDLGVTFTNGLANPEINKSSGDIIYIDNRPLVSRSSRQKEDIKIILEF